MERRRKGRGVRAIPPYSPEASGIVTLFSRKSKLQVRLCLIGSWEEKNIYKVIASAI